MSIFQLDSLFNPRSVAVIGASEEPGSIGSALITNMLEAGFSGNLIPVNPKRSAVHGIPCLQSVQEASLDVDLAVIATPIATVPGIIDECVQAGVKGAVIISAGGRETGAQGLELESRIKARADQGQIRLIGPNCLGIICPATRINASFASLMPSSGALAFISQSGAICTSMLDLSLREKMGFRYFISVGSMLDVDFGDLIDYVGSDPKVQSLLLYIESLSNFRKFMSAARAISRIKPIVVIKSGRSKAGARAAASHTGALTGEDEVYEAAFKRAGAVRVHSIGEFFRCAELLSKQPCPRGPRLTVLTNSGGPGVMAVDAIAEAGLEPSELGPETIQCLDRVLPVHWSRGNPVDILGDATAERYVQAVSCLNSKDLDGLLIIMNPQAMTDPGKVAEALIPVLSRKPYPVLASWMGGRGMEQAVELFNTAGIATFETPEEAVQAFMYLHRYARNLKKLTEIPSYAPSRYEVNPDQVKELVHSGLHRKKALLSEFESKALLQAYGIPVNPTQWAASAEESIRLAKEMGFPVAMKLLSLDISHKTEAGGVQLDLRSDNEIKEAFQRIMQGARRYDPSAEIQGVTPRPMIDRPELELLLGSKRDANFGPVLLFGMGGIFAEVLEDRNLALPPLNHLLAGHLIEGTRVHRLLRGYRNRPAADMRLLEACIIRLAQLVVDFPEITELDINPLIIHQGKPLALDARILVSPADKLTPNHLVISPYPSQYEESGVKTNGLELFIRPIQPEDAELLIELFESSSPTSIYYRFFSPLKSLPLDMLVRFTQIDYDREIALVALSQVEGRERILAVARVIGHIDGKRGEFAVLVADPWQGKGVGRELLRRCLKIAKQRDMEMIYGLVLKENSGMLRLAQKLGFDKRWSSEDMAFELTLDLKTRPLEELA